MTLSIDRTAPVPGRAAEDAVRPAPTTSRATTVLRLAAGAGLIASPALWAAGMYTTPPASSESDVAYVTSLGVDPTMTQVSALLLHYGTVFIGLCILAAPSLVRGARGAWATVIGALVTALGFVSLSGMLLSDWWNLATSTTLPGHTAAKVFSTFQNSSLLWAWNGLEMFSLLGTIVVLVGLARAGVVSWWNLPVFVGGFLGLFLVPWDMPHLSALGVLLGFAPYAVIGLRLVRRGAMARA